MVQVSIQQQRHLTFQAENQMSYRYYESSADDLALQDAASENDVWTVLEILAYSRQTEIDVQSLICAIQYTSIEVAHALLDDHRVDPSARYSRALQEAVTCGELGLVERMMTYPTANCTLGLRWAILANLTDMVKLFLADPRTQIGDSLYDAVQLGKRGCVTLLLADPRTDPSADDNRAMRTAIANGDTMIVNSLLLEPRVVAHMHHTPLPSLQTVRIHTPVLTARIIEKAWARRREAVLAFASYQATLLFED